jgi:hypothetical protein
MAAMLHCPECGEEYLATTLECADCGVPLSAAATQASGPSSATELPPVSQLVCVRAAALAIAKGLSEQLVEAGISHRIEAVHDDRDDGSLRRPGANLPYGVYVRERELQAALGVDRAFMRTIIPDLPEEEQAAVAEGGCPACGSPVSSDARECPDCGLVLIEVG